MIEPRVLVLAVAGSLLVAGAVRAEKKEIKPSRAWTGVVKDPALGKLAPPHRYITDSKEFAKLWKGWRGKEKVPEIDFSKNLVLVEVALGGPNVPRMTIRLDEAGDVTWMSISTLIGGPGFGFQLAEIPRAGVKSVKGKKLPRKEGEP